MYLVILIISGEWFFQPDSEEEEEEFMDFNCDDSVIFKDQSYFAQQKMEQLDEKIQNKTHALKAIKESRKVDDLKARTWADCIIGLLLEFNWVRIPKSSYFRPFSPFVYILQC